MINFPLTQIPERSQKPRESGLTMAMDKGLSARQAEEFLSVASGYTDIVKLGWATSCVTPNLGEKLEVYKGNSMPFYFGGTMLEAFYIRGQFDEYCRILDQYGAEYVEVSDGSIDISQDEKCRIIRELAKNFRVLSEVGSKDPNTIIPPYKWVEMIQQELDAGSWKVIAEARESGTVGMFRSTGEVRSDLIDEILHSVPGERLLWEAPQKKPTGLVHKIVREQCQSWQHCSPGSNPTRNPAVGIKRRYLSYLLASFIVNTLLRALPYLRQSVFLLLNRANFPCGTTCLHPGAN